MVTYMESAIAETILHLIVPPPSPQIARLNLGLSTYPTWSQW